MTPIELKLLESKLRLTNKLNILAGLFLFAIFIVMAGIAGVLWFAGATLTAFANIQ